MIPRHLLIGVAALLVLVVAMGNLPSADAATGKGIGVSGSQRVACGSASVRSDGGGDSLRGG